MSVQSSSSPARDAKALLSASPETKKDTECEAQDVVVILHLVSMSLQKAAECSLHLLILQSGSCEFGANDSG